jgi:THO complex subunit 1
LDGFYDAIFVNDDLETTYRSLESYIFADNDDDERSVSNPTDGLQETLENTDVEMVGSDAPGPEVILNKEMSAASDALESGMDSGDQDGNNARIPSESHLTSAES